MYYICFFEEKITKAIVTIIKPPKWYNQYKRVQYAINSLVLTKPCSQAADGSLGM